MHLRVRVRVARGVRLRVHDARRLNSCTRIARRSNSCIRIARRNSNCDNNFRFLPPLRSEVHFSDVYFRLLQSALF